MDNADLLRRLHAAEQRARDAGQERDSERREAQRLIAEERQQREAVEKEMTEIKKRVDPTDFRSYLALCHHRLFLALAIQTKLSLTSASGVTRVDGKFFPFRLLPWAQSPPLHEQCQRRWEAEFGEEKRFLPLLAIDTIKRFLSEDPVADEDDVGQFQFLAVEGCTKNVVESFLSLHHEGYKEVAGDNHGATATSDSDLIPLPRHIKFVDNPYGLLYIDSADVQNDLDLPAYVPAMTAAQKAVLDAAEERNRGRGDGPPPAKRRSSPTRPKLYLDQWCFRIDDTHDGPSQVPVLVIEYKAAHKLRAKTIKSALENSADGDLFRDVVRDSRSRKISLDEPVQQVLKDKKQTAHVIVQAFDYMIEFGLPYCYVTSGEALLLLHMDPSEPRTLYYHLAVPREEVTVTENGEGSVRRTAVALVSTMISLALKAAPMTQRWKQNAQKNLKPWPTPYEDMDLTDSSDNDDDDDAKEHQRAFLRAPAEPEGCKEPTKRSRKKDGDDDQDKEYRPLSGRGNFHNTALAPSSGPTTRSATQSGTQGSTQGSTQGGSRSHAEAVSNEQATNAVAEEQSRMTTDGKTQPTNAGATAEVVRKEKRKKPPRMPKAYCSQACLLGLIDDGPLDPACPNFRLHQFRFRGDDEMCTKHYCSGISFVKMLRSQLEEDLDEWCECLDKYGKFGATGVLFRLVSRRRGYCIVGKGVQEPHLPRLWHEQRIYSHLREQRGSLVPVCLGMVRLAHEYWTSSGAHVSHMLLLSYCGEPLGQRGLDLPADIDDQQNRLWQELRDQSVDHGDQRLSNLVWNAELQRLMCIDFDCARIMQVTDEEEEEAQRKREKKKRREKKKQRGAESQNEVKEEEVTPKEEKSEIPEKNEAENEMRVAKRQRVE